MTFLKPLIQIFPVNHYMRFDFNVVKVQKSEIMFRERDKRSFQPKITQKQLNFVE